MQKIIFVPPFFVEILQKYCNVLLFWVLWICLFMATKSDGTCFKETLILIFMQKIKFMSYLSFAKILQLCYFGYIRHACQPTQKKQYLPVRHFDVYLQFLLEILHFNKSSKWLTKSILIHNLRKIFINSTIKYINFNH